MERKLIKNPDKWCMFEQRHHSKKVDEQAIIKMKHPHPK